MNDNIKQEMYNFSIDFLKENNLANFSDGRLDSIFEIVFHVIKGNIYKGPFRHGRSNFCAVLDVNGNLIYNPRKRNSNSKSRLLVALLNSFV